MTYNISTGQEITLGLLVVWDIVWRAFALWRAARNNHRGWYIALLVLNTVGILPIIYLLTHADRNEARLTSSQTFHSVGE